ncbi:MAG: hypothetical protein [Circular genetic element sp.]|nr:MAG: hypothetical protein [Circular genetic element sp.]
MIRGGGTAKQIIDLPGARIDTLYTTVESGTNEDGTEWEKHQATAPRTFEEAVTDKNKVPLSKKLADILEKINQLDGGEYDTLLQEIDNIKQEIAGLDLGQWNYIVPNMQQIIFKQNDSSDIKLGLDADGAWNIYYGTNKIFEINDLGDIVTMPYRLDVEDMLNVSMDARIDGYLTVGEISTFKGDVHYPANVGLFFGKANTDHYLLYLADNNNLYLNRKVGSTASTIFSVDPNNNKTYFRAALQVALCPTDSNPSVGGIDFFASEGNVHKIVESQATGNLIFCNDKRGTENKFIESAHVTLNGEWVFKKNITAPNIASTTELMSLGREIIEQDLSIIENQQAATEQDITNIETQQTLTDMELMMIGGQVA